MIKNFLKRISTMFKRKERTTPDLINKIERLILELKHKEEAA